MKTVFIGLADSADRASDLRHACNGIGSASAATFRVSIDVFRVIPRSPMAYWAPEVALSTFAKWEQLESRGRHAAAGISTKDNSRFLRCWWEVSESSLGSVAKALEVSDALWVPLAKGGAFGRYYADIYLQLRWARNGAEVKAFLSWYRESRGWGHQWTAAVNGYDYYGSPGVTWPSRSQSGFSVRAMPSGGVFGDKGPAVFVPDDSLDELEFLLTIMNSRVFGYLVALQMAFGSYEPGVIQRTPVPEITSAGRAVAMNLGRRAWRCMRSLDTTNEVSHAFLLPAALQIDGRLLGERARGWSSRVMETESELRQLQGEIDDLCFELYGISEGDRRAITDGFGVDSGETDGSPADGDDEDDDDGRLEVDPTGLAAGLVSWAVGVGVGRFDVRLATGEREWPAEPDPFDPLPVCSPGMLTGANGLPLEVPPEGYPVRVSEVLVDDPGHELDITARVRSVFDVAFGDDADGWWADVGVALGARGGEVASWLSKGFFDHHLKTYSKSRRKAPILWPLATSSGSYTLWLYAHRTTADSLHRVLNDVVVPKLGVEQRRLSELVQEAGPEPSAAQRKAIDRQETLVGEVTEFRAGIEAVLPLWHPDLNDGIVLVLAPLWRLFAHHRAWSKELKKHWDRLAAGEYDWAQLAMRLWPERVVPKCAEDRSLAIAHGLEEVFWVQDDDNPDKWHPRRQPTTPIDQLIAERTNPATTAALQELAS